MNRVRVRLADDSDAPTLAELGARTFHEAYIDSLDAEALAPFIESAFGIEVIRAELASPSVTVLIAEVEREIVGYAMVKTPPSPSAASTPQSWRESIWASSGSGAASEPR